MTLRSAEGEFRRWRTRSTINESPRFPRKGTMAEIVQIAMISSVVTPERSKKPRIAAALKHLEPKSIQFRPVACAATAYRVAQAPVWSWFAPAPVIDSHFSDTSSITRLQNMSIFYYTFTVNMYCYIYKLKFEDRQQLSNREKWSGFCMFTETDWI